MDMKDTSAMTEASGLVTDQEGTELAVGAGSDNSASGIGGSRSSRQPSPDAAAIWAHKLREVTVKAPLQSLFVAFLLGIWVARRR